MFKSLEEIIVAEKEQNLPFWKIVMNVDCAELDITEEEAFNRMKETGNSENIILFADI